MTPFLMGFVLIGNVVSHFVHDYITVCKSGFILPGDICVGECSGVRFMVLLYVCVSACLIVTTLILYTDCF